MSKIFLIAAIIIAILLVIFGAQNTVQVSITFLGWSTQLAPLGVVILISGFVGFVVAYLVGLQGAVRHRLEKRRTNRRIRELETQLNLAHQRTTGALQPPSGDEQNQQ